MEAAAAAALAASTFLFENEGARERELSSFIHFFSDLAELSPAA